MKKRIYIILVVVLLLSICSKNVLASELCSSKGYTVITINGIFTDENGAKYNKNQLSYKLSDIYNNQPLKIDYLYNPTHLAGVGDLVDAVGQGLFDQKSDYDLVEMLNDASAKVTTQKLLLVGHSQGNFYANNFYEKVASKEGGVPSQSIGVYSVATPADHVAGGGKYLTSDTDSVIASAVARFIKILSPNVHIPLQSTDGNGHSFGDVYLKYQGDKIISGIKSSLDKLQNNDEQDSQYPCISPQELSIFHKVQGVMLASADFVINNTKQGAIYIANSAYNIGSTIGSTIHNTTLAIGKMVTGLLANAVNSLPNTNSLTTILPDMTEPIKNNISTNDLPQKQVAIADEVKNEEANIVTASNPVSNENITNNNLQPVAPVVSIPIYYSGGGGGGSSAGGNGGGGGGSGTNGGGNNTVDNPVVENTNTNNDTIAPVITIIGANPIDIIKGSVYTDLGATATDEKDGVIIVTTTGVVDTATIGTYTITYSASDLSNNTSKLTRTVNVIENIITPIPDTTAPVITILGNNPEIIKINSVYTDAGATALDVVDGVREVVTTGLDIIDNTKLGNYTITYTTSDIAGNISTMTRTVTVDKIYDYTYIPNKSFGTNNGDGRDWQIWSFNGSNVYDWSDTYVNKYLKEQFKVQTYTGGFWCSQCLQRGIFKRDPQKGFDLSDLSISTLEGNPQNSMNGITYDVVLQWDPVGYTYTISHDGNTDLTGHTNISNVNENMWVGWDGSFNDFTIFPSGDWQEKVHDSPLDRTGGSSMVLQPYPVYDPFYVPDPPPILSSENKILSFTFSNLSPAVYGTMEHNNHFVFISVPYGTDISSLTPVITLSDKATMYPQSGVTMDFNYSINYNVWAENGSGVQYSVHLTILPKPIIEIDTKAPTITSYTLNGTTGDININPTKTNPLSLVLNASENVNWMTVKIENTNDSHIYRTFQDGVGCIDDTNTCLKSWEGDLSKGTVLQNGETYKIKVHMQDAAKNDYDEYLPSIITIDIPLIL